MNITTDRYLTPVIKNDLQAKMVFVGGPRQVGKTTLAKTFLQSKSEYLNWDNLDDKSTILKRQFNKTKGIIAFDEIHKYKLWRTLIKGTFDSYSPDLKILVTGSGRLDYFRKGGDSLAGRYHYHRLHPFTLGEISPESKPDALQALMTYGGFPEPFLKSNETFYKRWSREMMARVVTQDLKDLHMVRDISMIELLSSILPTKVASPLSIKSIQEDLQVSPNTVEQWIGMLENLYVCFRISPFGINRVKAIKKTKKLYMWDWGQVEESGARFENLVASHLLKYCHYHEDTFGERMELSYLRDVEGREVDFVVVKNKKPLFMVECKTGERALNPALLYYKTRLKVPKAFQVHMGHKDYGHEVNNVRLLPFATFSKEIGLL